MTKKVVSSELIKVDEGIIIGGVSSYVQDFKDIEKGKKSSVSRPNTYNKSSVTKNRVKRIDVEMPSEYSNEEEKNILMHFYSRLGNGGCTDFEKVKGRVASSINRLFNKNFTHEDIKKKLNQYLTAADFNIIEAGEEAETVSTTVGTVEPKKEKIKVDIFEGNYTYKKGLKPLTDDQLDLCKFIDPKNLCFSSDDSGIFLAVKPGNQNAFDKLFNFSMKEQIVFEMFKAQLGDEHKAKKLVLMSRILNKPARKTRKKSSTKKKTNE